MTDATARRILDQMRLDLHNYSPANDVRALDNLVGRLSGSLDALVGEADDDWLEELRSAWWPLEYVNATVLDAGRFALSPKEMQAVAQARDEFLALLRE